MKEKIFLVQDAITIHDYTSNCGNNNKKSKQIFFSFFLFFLFFFAKFSREMNVRLCITHILCINWCQMQHKDISDIIDANCECFGCYSTSVDDMSSMYLTVSLRTLHNFSQNNIHLRNLCRVKYHSLKVINESQSKKK